MLDLLHSIELNNIRDYRGASVMDCANFVAPSFAPAGDIDNGELRW